MAEINWKPSLAAVLSVEGGNDDDPMDHGGRTSRGITQREYNAWRRERRLPPMDVWKAPQEDIETIYHDEYWEPWCDLLPIGADFLLFNMNVNAGAHAATVILQRALHVIADGRIGPITREAIRTADQVKLIEEYSGQCRAYYLSLHQPKFIKGWLNRVEIVRRTALQMIGKG